MNKIVIKKMISKFSRELSDFIYKYLNDDEKNEIKIFLKNNPNKDRAYAIWILYMTESQRRRMNPRFVQAVIDYISKHPRCELKVVDIPNKVKKIELHDTDGGECVLFDSSEGEDIKLWKNQITIKEELKSNEEDVPTEIVSIKMGINEEKNNSLFVRVKRFFKNLRRKLFYSKQNRWRDKKKTNFSDKFKKGSR